MSAKLLGPISWEDADRDLGDILISVPRPPVSVQANSATRTAFVECIRLLTRACPFVITTDVTVDIEWFVSQQERYESDATADVDNIIKPVLDALSGPDGLIVNDCQVQAVISYWMDPISSGQEIRVRIRTPFEKFRFPKRSIQFVQLGRALCFPFDMSYPRELRLDLLRHVEKMLLTRDRMRSEFGEEIASLVLPLQRLFHRTRVAGFPVLMLADLYRELQEVEPTRMPLNDS